jgi:hypothetical protein
MRTDTAGGGRHTEGRRALQRAVGRDREREIERERERVREARCELRGRGRGSMGLWGVKE